MPDALDAALDATLTPPERTGSAASIDPLDNALDQTVGSPKERLRASVVGAVREKPDAYAEAKNLARMTGIPAPVVSRNLDDVRQRQAVASFDSLIQTAPMLAAAMSQPEFAKVAHDDTPELGLVETTINSFRRGYRSLRQQLPATALRSNAANVEAIDRIDALLAQGRDANTFSTEEDPLGVAQMSAEQRGDLRTQLIGSITGNAADLTTQEGIKRTIPQPGVITRAAAAGKEGDWRGVLREFVSDPLTFLASIGPESAVANAPGLAAAAIVPGGLPTRIAAAGVGSFTSDYASSILDALGDAGVDISNPIAIQQAAADPVLMNKVGRQAFAHAAVVGAVDTASGKVAGALTLPKRITAKLAAKPVARELAGIAAQAPIQGALGAVGEAGGEIASGQQLDPFQILAEFVGEFAGTPGEVLAVGGREAVGRVQEARAKAAEATSDAGNVAKLMASAEASKLRQRDPESFRQFVKDTAANGPVQEVFVDGKTFEDALAQSGVPFEQFAERAPHIASQVDEAVASGGDVRIPIEDLAVMAGTPLAEALTPHVRTSADAFSQSEAEAVAIGQSDTLKGEVERTLGEAQEVSAFQQSADKVRAGILEQLTATNRFTPAVNDQYATLLGNFYATTAARLKVTPEELAARHPVNIAAEDLAGAGALQQDEPSADGATPPTPPKHPRGWATVEPGDSPKNMPPGKGSKGLFRPGRDGAPDTIALLKSADLSTFLHESGHFFFETLGRLAAAPDAPADVAADFRALLDHVGYKGTAAEWLATPVDQRRDGHETIARGFEAYLFEGKAPAPELQSLFSRFRAWLLNVYRELTALNVELTPEVRGVFDRLLASSQAIAATERAGSMGVMFRSAEEAGMTEAEFARYRELATESHTDAVEELSRRSLRDMRWLDNARGRELRRLQADARTKRKAIEAQVTAEVQAEPVNQARAFLREHPGATDAAAEFFGFTSEDHLRYTLDSEPTASAKIEALTDRRTLETYGDLSDETAMRRAADQAVHNEARQRMVAAELSALEKAVRAKESTGTDKNGRAVSRNPLPRLARAFAEATVARKKVGEIRPIQFAAAETRAAKESFAALKKGDLAAAAAAKQNQLVNSYATRAAYRALDEVEKALRYLGKFDSESTRKGLDAEYVDQIDAMLERFDLRRGTTGRDIAKRKSLAEWITKQEENGIEPVIDDRLRDEAFSTSYKEMTLEEMRGLVDAVRNIEHLGRLKKKLLTAKDQRDFDATVADMETAIVSNAKKVIPEERASDRGIFVDAKRLFRSFVASHRKFASQAREFDGFAEGGTVWDNLVRNMNEAGDNEAVAREKATEHVLGLMEALDRGRLRAKTYYPEAGKSFTGEERIAIVLNLGNETNAERIMTGERLTQAAVTAIQSDLTSAEAKFVNDVWAYLDSFRPLIAAKEKRVSGVTPEWVEAQPFAITLRDGTKVDMTGGYYPIKYDPLRSERSGADVQAEIAKQMTQGLYARSQTRRGHLKARTESTGRPLRYDLDVIPEHLSQVIHDLSWHEYLLDANRLLRASRIEDAVRKHYGPIVLQSMKSLLTDIAVGETGAQSAGDSVMNHLRYGATITGLGFNVSNTLINLVGITQSMVRVGTPWIVKGMTHWIGDAARFESSASKIYEMSDFMRLRSKTMNRELNELRNKVSGKSTRLEAAYFWLQAKTQQFVDIPTWWGAYEKAMAQDGVNEAKAIALADQAVVDAQGGGQTKDLAAIQRGGAGLKLFTTFYSFFSTTYNLTAEVQARTNFKDPISVLKYAMDMALLYTIPAAIGTVVKASLKGELDDRDKLKKNLIADGIAYRLGTMVLVRETTQAVQAARGVGGGMGYTGPASVRFFEDIFKLGQQIGQGEVDAQFWKALNNVGGVLFHYPAGQLNRTAEGIAAMADGKTENPGVLLVGPSKP